MLEGKTAFSGIGGSVDLFQGPSYFPLTEEWIESNSIALEAQEVIVSDLPISTKTTSRKRKRRAENPSIHLLSASDLTGCY